MVLGLSPNQRLRTPLALLRSPRSRKPFRPRGTVDLIAMTPATARDLIIAAAGLSGCWREQVSTATLFRCRPGVVWT